MRTSQRKVEEKEARMAPVSNGCKQVVAKCSPHSPRPRGSHRWDRKTVSGDRGPWGLKCRSHIHMQADGCLVEDRPGAGKKNTEPLMQPHGGRASSDRDP